MKEQVLFFFTIFLIGYLVGAMFNGLNTLIWPGEAKFFFCLFFILNLFFNVGFYIDRNSKY